MRFFRVSRALARLGWRASRGAARVPSSAFPRPSGFPTTSLSGLRRVASAVSSRSFAASTGASSSSAPGAPEPPPSPPTLPAVVEIEDEAQLEQVVASSARTGVSLVFDFYADWCGPCKTLTPKLESLVAATGGKATLVKINVDAHPTVSDQLRIQSLPTVMLMSGGRFLDTFVGVKPDQEIRAFVDKAAALADDASRNNPNPTDEHPATHTQPPMDPGALVDAAFAAIDADGAREALAVARDVVGGNFPEPEEIAAAAARCELVAESGFDAVDADSGALRRAVEDAVAAKDAEAADDARHALATAQMLGGDATGAIETALEATRRGDKERGRRLCVRLFDVAGGKHPAAVAGRRRLANVLFA
jgi:putative thioredoxin